MNYTITDNIPDTDREVVFNHLLEYNLARIEDKDPKELGIFLKDDSGALLAGLTGETHGNWLTIEFLWVSEALRGQAIGSSVLEKAENEARKRGCKFAFLDTFDFQAPAFYEKLGYKEVFVLENYPVNGKRHYYTKTL